MRHWSDPRVHPSAIPPIPSSRESNDIPARVTGLEIHAQWAHYEQRRVEAESRLRAKDLGEGMAAMGNRQDQFEARLRVLETDRHIRRRLWKLVATLGISAGAFARFAIAIILLALVVLGAADIQFAKDLVEFARGSRPPV